VHHEQLVEKLTMIGNWLGQDPVRRQLEVIANPHLIEGELPGVRGPCAWEHTVFVKGVLKFNLERLNSTRIEEDVSIWKDREVYLKWKVEYHELRLPVHAITGLRTFVPEETIMVFE
jgi:hypothetical protein